MKLKTILILVHWCALSLATPAPELQDSSVENSLVAPANVFRFDYKYYPQSGWFKLHELPADWHTARLQCYAEGATLASPYDANIMFIIRSIKSNQKLGTLHSGVHASFSDGVFTSVDGIPIDNLAIKWRLNEPNYNQTKQCTAYFDNGMGVTNCDNILPYICFRNNIAGGNLTECGTVDKAYSLDARTKHCYKFHNRGESWARAMRICQAEGGYLAIINNNEEAEVLKGLFNSIKPIHVDHSDSVYVGYRRWGLGDEFWTIHGQTLEEAGYANWSKGEPNGYRGTINTKQSCGTMYRSGQLDDDWCHRSFAFICEKTTDSLLTGPRVARGPPLATRGFPSNDTTATWFMDTIDKSEW